MMMRALTSSKAVAFARVAVPASSDRPEFCFFSLNHRKRCNLSFMKLVQNKGIYSLHAVPPKDQVDLELETAEPQAQESEQTNESKFVRITFQLQKNCNFGEQFLIVGDDPMLGSWDPLNALPMTWSEGHVWTAELDVPAEKSIQFKFILREKDGKIVWQPGSDRTIRPWKTMSRITVSEDWENAQLQKIFEEDQHAQENEQHRVKSEASSFAEILDNPQEKVESNASKISTIEDTQIHKEEKPVGTTIEDTQIHKEEKPVGKTIEDTQIHKEEKPFAVPTMQQITRNGISSSVEKPRTMVAENISSSEDLIKSTSLKRNKKTVLQPSEESANSPGNDDIVHDVGHNGNTKSLGNQAGTLVESSLFDYEGVPVLVPGLIVSPTEATDEAIQVQEMTTLDTSGAAFETQDQNIPEWTSSNKRRIGGYCLRQLFNEEQETYDATPQEINTNINNEPELLYNEHEDQSHLSPEMEDRLNNQTVDGNPLLNDIKRGQEAIKKLLNKLGFI